jgi:hypothetical protein
VKNLTTEDTEGTEMRIFPISKNLDRLLAIYEKTLNCGNYSDSFLDDIQQLIVDVIRNGNWEDGRWPVIHSTDPYDKWLEKLDKGGEGND